MLRWRISSCSKPDEISSSPTGTRGACPLISPALRTTARRRSRPRGCIGNEGQSSAEAPRASADADAQSAARSGGECRCKGSEGATITREHDRGDVAGKPRSRARRGARLMAQTVECHSYSDCSETVDANLNSAHSRRAKSLCTQTSASTKTPGAASAAIIIRLDHKAHGHDIRSASTKRNCSTANSSNIVISSNHGHPSARTTRRRSSAK